MTATKSRLKKSAKKTAKTARVIHRQVAERPHDYLLSRSKLYRKWHNFRFHRHVHATITGAATLLTIVTVASTMQHAFALSSWIQTDWSGGIGASSSNQYDAATNVDTGTAGQASLAASANKFTNPGLDTSATLDSWLGVDPASIAGLKFYVKADSGVYTDSGTTAATDGQQVQQWNDLSGNSQNATAPSSSRRPTLHANQVNGRPALTFTQTSDTTDNDDALNAPLSSLTNLSDTTIFTVGSFDYANQPTNNYDYLYSVYDSTDPASTAVGSIARGSSDSGFPDGEYTYYNAAALFGPNLTAGFKQFTQQFSNTGARSFLWLNGVSQTVDTANSESTITHPEITIGKWQNGTWALNGRVAELLLYNTALNASDVHAVQNYLNNKYNLGTSALTIDSSVKHTGSGSAKVVAGANTSELLQTVNVGTTHQYQLSAYAYIDGTTAVDTSAAQLYANGSTVSTTYTAAGGGWYKLTGTVTGANAARSYGVQVEANKTVYVDDLSLTDYLPSGTLTSAVFDGLVQNNWGQLSYNGSIPAGTTVSFKVRSGNQPDLSDASNFSSCSALSSGDDATSSCAPDKTRYAQYQVTFTSTGSNDPALTDMALGYSASDTTPPPTNASSILMFRSNGGASVASDGWDTGNPYFSWTAGADDVGGSGILGYCLYLGQDPTGNPITTKGDLGTSPLTTNGACQFAVSSASLDTALNGAIGTALSSSTNPYYLNIKAIDVADNVFTGSPEQFEFKYDNVAPSNPSFISAPSQFVSNKQVTLTWPTNGSDAAADDNSGIAGLQYRIGANGTWYGASHTGAQDATDLLLNGGSYTTINNPDFANLQDGNNLVYFRTWDIAGNVSPAFVTTVVKINSTAPSSPQNVTATPVTNTANSFGFSWLAPATFTGSVGNLTYCYTVNALPTNSNCTYTAAGQTSLDAGAYATEPGDNTFYLAAKDEAGNINYATASSVTFTANTPAPGVPLNLDIADISIKATSTWKLALSWNAPDTVGAGIATYKIFRSTDGSNFTDVANTAGTSYVDASLGQRTYYYKVEACDSANNCGGNTMVSSLFPTGKFTAAAGLISGPTSTVNTRTATINWVTDRTSDSRIEYGLASGNYSATEAANSDQVVTHSLTLNNLQAGTTYYYRAQWTDLDGNIGTSAESAFTTLPAPTVSNVTVGNINLHAATISFTTSGASSVKVYYGTSSSFGSVQTLNTSSTTSTYGINLASLDAGKDYFFKVDTFDAFGNEYNSGQIDNFATPPQPAITNIQFSPVPGALTGTEQITWTTNVPTTSAISYGQQGQAQQEAIDSSFVTEHSMTIESLPYNTPYSIVARSVDKLGNGATSDQQVFHTGLDTRPPTISAVNVQPSIRGTGASAQGQLVISWKTDKAGTSQVAFGQGSGGSYSSKTAEDGALVTNHVVVVSNLSTSQVYHLQAISKDAEGIRGVSADQTTIIGQASDNALSIVFNALQGIFGL